MKLMHRVFSALLIVVLLLGILPAFDLPAGAASTGLGEKMITGGQRDFLWPVPGEYKLTSCFLDPDANRVDANGNKRLHYAIDIGATSGKPVVAPYDGEVVSTDGVNNSTSGINITLKHTYKLASGTTMTLYTRYLHLKSFSVEVGQKVSKGEEIAKVGSTGTSSSHLDFHILTNTSGKSASNSLDPYVNDLLQLPADIVYKGSCDCCKSYIATIKELYAKPLSYLDKCTPYPSHCKIQVSSSTTYVKSLPCSEKTDANSTNVEVASKGATYEAIGLVKNTAGNYWYKVKAKNGSIGYMYSGDTTFVSRDISDIKTSGITVPTDHAQGKTYVLTGTVQSSYTKLEDVSVYIYDAQGERITGDKDAVTGNKYVFTNSTIDNNTRFAKLTVGTHTYEVVAYYKMYYINESGFLTSSGSYTTVYTKTFNVVNASCSHSYTYKTTKTPTTSAAGTLTGTCSKCSGTKTVSLPKLNTTDYTYAVTKSATCTATGTGRYTWKTTTYGSFYFDVTIAKKAHSWKDATCTAAQTCTVCGTTSGSALGHNYSSKVIAATCTAQGYTVYTCSRCASTYKDNYQNALGHNYVNGNCSRCSGKDPNYCLEYKEDGTLLLIADGSMASLSVNLGEVLDLNGHVLTVNSLASFGQIIDSVGGGGLIVSNLAIMDNQWLPVRDSSGCYRFFQYQVESLGSKETANGAVFGFSLDFEDANAYLTLLDSEDVQITVTLKVGERTQSFAFSKTLLRRYVQLCSKYPDMRAAMKLNVTGIGTLTDGTVITITPAITAAGGKINKIGESMQYIA